MANTVLLFSNCIVTLLDERWHRAQVECLVCSKGFAKEISGLSELDLLFASLSYFEDISQPKDERF
jgi:hypothetical protein